MLTGSEILEVLEEAVTFAHDPNGSSGGYPYASGLRYNVDVNLIGTPGSIVTDIEVNSRMEGDWTPLDMDMTYTVVTSNFLASGSDGFSKFGEFEFIDLYLEYAQAFITYCREVGELVAPPLEEHSTKSYNAGPEVRRLN